MSIGPLVGVGSQLLGVNIVRLVPWSEGVFCLLALYYVVQEGEVRRAPAMSAVSVRSSGYFPVAAVAQSQSM